MKKYLFIIITFITYSCLLHSQDFVQINYEEIGTEIANPERGFYHQVINFTSSTLQSFKEDNVRLILKNYNLEGFNDKALSSTILNGIKKDFEIVRKEGFKIIVRFAYTVQLTTPYGDATPEIVLLHINQLKDIINKNSDIILTFQAGFIGTWGEWYYTDHFSESPGVVSEQNWADRKMVVDSILSILPTDRMVQMRTPTFKKKNLLDANFTAITADDAYGITNRARLGHHNDCFVAGNSDYGTYKDTMVEKPFLALDSRYSIVGGETCNKSSESNCENSLKELKRFHWSYLNLDYNISVLNQWKEEGCFDEIGNKLGYRYILEDTELQTNGAPGGAIDFELNLINIGWANPTNAYKIQLVLENVETKELYKYTIDQEIRKWEINKLTSLDVHVGLPDYMEAGTYEMFMSIKDERVNLGFNPDYSIRLANLDLWNGDKGFNLLQNSISISPDDELPTYVGDDYFFKEGEPTDGFEGPVHVAVSQYNSHNIVYWTADKSLEGLLVQVRRSTDNQDFEVIAVKKAEDIYLIDEDLIDGTQYQYEVQYVLGDLYSERNILDVSKENATEREFIYHEIDGIGEDWDIIPPVVTGDQNGMVSLHLSNDALYLYFLAKANEINNYSVVLNLNDGEKFKISTDSLFQEIESEWSFIKKIEIEVASKFIEGKILLSDIEFNTSLSLMGQFFLNDEDVWGEGFLFQFQKYPVLQSPQNFKVNPSVVTPFSKVKISWVLDSQLDGVVISKSVDQNTNYQVLKELGSNDNYYLDSGLDSSLVYYYKMYSYSGIVRSYDTDEIDIKLGGYTPIELLENQFGNIEIYPNPMTQNSLLKINSSQRLDITIELYDSNMKHVKLLFSGEISGQKEIIFSRQNLPKGIYYICFKNPKVTQLKKLIIL